MNRIITTVFLTANGRMVNDQLLQKSVFISGSDVMKKQINSVERFTESTVVSVSCFIENEWVNFNRHEAFEGETV
jgi:hypothetical protein